MATRFFSRSLVAATKQSLSSAISRSFSSISPSKPAQSLLDSSFSILRLRPLVAVAANLRHISPVSSFRTFATRQTSSSLNDPNPNWSNRPPKETILLDGCDFEHWLVVMEKPEGDPTRDEIIDSYIKTLAQVVGSEEEARMKIYSVSTRHYFAFGALVSEELSYKIKELPRVRWVLPDSYLDVKNKDYGGEPFINGQAVPYDPKYHEEWVRNNARANERNRRNDRPRNFDRSRNFERRREMQMANQNPGANMGGRAPGGPNIGGAPTMGPPNSAGMQPNNMGGPLNSAGMQPPMPPNSAGMRPNNMGGPPNSAGMHPNNMGGPPNSAGMHPNNMGGPPNNMRGPPNMGGMPPGNIRGMQGNMGGHPPSFYGGGTVPPGNKGYIPSNPSQFPPGNEPNSGGMPYESIPGSNPNHVPNTAGNDPYQHQNMPGRDLPPPQNY